MTTITISGPGGVINNEAAVVVQALRDAGFEVTVDNKCDETPPLDAATVSEHVARFTEKCGPWKVHVKVSHVPWGG
jgi:hypothetical protein